MSLYVILLSLHNIVRWAVLILGVLALIQTLQGSGAGRTITAGARRAVSSFMGSVHLQVLLGLLLFAYTGMQKIPAFADSRASFKWEHVGLGLLVAVFATLANGAARRGMTEAGSVRSAAIWTGLALLLSLLAMPWFRPLLRLFTAG